MQKYYINYEAENNYVWERLGRRYNNVHIIMKAYISDSTNATILKKNDGNKSVHCQVLYTSLLFSRSLD